MLSKWLFGLFIVLAAAGIWVFSNPSYQKSLESKVRYAMGDFDGAYALAKESFEMDPYNRMASTVMAQSQTALKYVRYNEEAERYIKEIRRIADQKTVTPAERAKIKMMAAIMVDSYQKIAPTVVTDDELVMRARSNYEQFEKLHHELALPR
jgi:tetratricopeptide (TPR) repeat protein